MRSPVAVEPYRGRHEVARLPARTAEPRRWPVALLVLASGALAYVGARGPGAPDRYESALIADATSLVRNGFSPFEQWDANSAAAIQVAAYTGARNAVSSVAGVAAARELMVLASVVTVLLTAALVRRFGLSVPATVVAAVVTAALPWALSGHRLVAPMNLAVPELLAAALFASPNARRRLAAAPAALFLVVAALTAPLVIPVALTAVAVLLAGRDIGISWPRTPRVVLAGALALVAVAALVGLRNQPATQLAPSAVDLVSLAAVAVGAGFGMVARWLRPFSLIVLACAATAALSGPSRTPLLLIALPAAAIVLGAAVDAAAEAGGLLRRRLPSWTALAAAGAVLVLVGVPLVLTAPPARAGSRGPQQAITWARSESGSALLLVDDAVWTAAGDPGGLPASERGRVFRYRDGDRLPTSTAPVFLIGSAPAPAAWRRSVRLASFDRTEVRLVVPSVDGYRRAFADDAQQRRAAGQALVSEKAVTVSPAAAPALEDGAVDGRLLTVLTYLAAGHRYTLAELPSVSGEAGPYSLRRSARITAVDGAPVAVGSPGADVLLQWLQAQLPPYQPRMSVDSRGATLAFPAPGVLLS